LQKYPAEVVRYFLVASHYRSFINYSEETLQIGYDALERFYHALKGLDTNAVVPAADSVYEQRFHAAMQDDFNTPEAIGVLFELVREIMAAKDEVIRELDSAEGDITATTGGKPGGEGYVAGGSKLVPRDRWTPFRAD
jgi:cysteinyl-tRNA synthetase